jgi:hypothetical protein
VDGRRETDMAKLTDTFLQFGVTKAPTDERQHLFESRCGYKRSDKSAETRNSITRTDGRC